MKLATLQLTDRTTAAVLDGEDLVPIAFADVGAWLRAGSPDPHEMVAAEPIALHEARFAPVVSQPSKIVCVGLNYRDHILEMNRPIPEYPTLFAKYGDSLIGAHDPVVLPHLSRRIDWEAELTIVVGSTVRHADDGEATVAIAGFTVANDISARDFQRRTPEWLQGKTFDGTNPVGPFLTTVDETGPQPDVEIGCSVNGIQKQAGQTSQLVFGPLALIRYISSITTLRPGDLILTGTPGGVGDGRDPQEYLAEGDVLKTWATGLGTLENLCVADLAAPKKEEV